LAPTLSHEISKGNVLKRFQAKWKPVRVKKTRQIMNLEPRFDSIEAEKALDERFHETDHIGRRDKLPCERAFSAAILVPGQLWNMIRTTGTLN
jgi:hypothetical protein